MNYLLRLLLKDKLRQKQQKSNKNITGFTMIELLVGTIIATLLIVPMLTFVVDILNRDVREQAKTNTEQELQATIDYIAQDMSQAFYIYDPDYNGDSESTPPISSYNEFINQLPYSDDNEKKPILVFWKREFVEHSVPVNPSDASIDCPDDETECDDAFVQSLVVYYLVEDNNNIWCQPSGGTCPKRIARIQIHDGVRDTQGNYVCRDNDMDTDGRSQECDSDSDKKKFQKDRGFNSYDRENPTNWTNSENYNLNENNADPLVNYIEGLTVDNVSDNNDIAQITIISNALRRSQNDFNCIEDASTDPPTYKNSPFCPKATAQLGGRSGFGE